MTYNGIFIRDVVGETPETTGTSWTNSPDIICAGTDILTNPADLVNRDNYDKGLPSGRSQTPLQLNHVYVRGINKTNGPQTSTVYLYYVDTSIVLWPQNWKYLDISYDNNDNQNWAELNAKAQEDIVGTLTPFYWKPPRTSIHYCLVAWVKDGPDQKTPPDLYSIGTVDDMGKFILSHPNVGWRNTIEVDKGQPAIQNTSPIKGPSQGGGFNLGVQCDNLPTDGFIEYKVTGPTRETSFQFPKTPITDPNYAPTIKVKWPANIDATLEFTYYKGATNPPDGANIIPIVGTWGAGTNLLSKAKAIAPNRLAKVHDYGTIDEAIDKEFKSVPPRSMFIVGSIPHKLV